ncbi:MAG: dephospho-CoA kinase [Planctomycetota bacterium]|nr:dephospho-CoA kinase [Planctomycetota bacterium]
MIGLAGGIGSGKSAVADILADLGCVVAHSDEMARAALRDPDIRAQLVQWWGNDILDDEGEIDRRAVAHIVFADAGQRRRLEGLTHPWIEARRAEQFAAAAPDAPALVIDAPLLFEAGLEEACDAVLFVDTPRQTRLTRLRAARGWEEADLKRREDSQLPLDVKRSRADYVIQNDGDLSDLVAQVRPILSQIVASHRS